MTKLEESGFIDVDISAFYTNQASESKEDKTDTEPVKSDETAEPEEVSNEETEEQAKTDTPKTFEEWGTELDRRLEENRNRSAAARLKEYDIESEFFKDFFNAMWADSACAKQLYDIGDNLRKAIKGLGFDKHNNPILAFICDKAFVQEKLIKTKLLNINSFKAIYQAVASKLVADSEFFKPNSYNIIYCLDLYTKSAEEMLEYLKLQKQVLVVENNSYKASMLALNKKVFLHILDEQNITNLINDLSKLADVQDVDVRTAKLNNIKTAKEIYSGISHTEVGKAYEHLSDKSISSIVSKLEQPAEKYMMLSLLYTLTKNKKAKEALASGKFNTIQINKLPAAMDKVAGLISDRPDASSIDKLIDAIMS